MRKKINEITDKEFEIHKQAIHTLLAEKDMNFEEEHVRFAYEIATHYYRFTRRES